LGYDWEVLIDVDSGRFSIAFPEPLQHIDTTAIAYHMVVKKADGTQLSFGSLYGPRFQLQILKFPNSRATDALWDAEWKNVYDLGPGPLSWHSMDIELFRAPFGLEDAQHSYFREQNGLSFIYLLGLDRISTFSEDTAGDGRVDNDPDILWLDQGLLVFPSRTPFTEPALTEQVPQLYSTDDLGTLVASSKYYLKVTKSGYHRSVRLIHINLIEGSDRVEAGGVVLTRGVHYYIDYQVGEIEFISDEVTTLGGPIQICYEYEKFL
jgi:cell surface protein SprA